MAKRTSVGITPAYAGKSLTGQTTPLQARDHPRVCGEKLTTFDAGKLIPGSPPRMRGKAYPPPCSYGLLGITPAYAGKSPRLSMPTGAAGDHPRVCGEKFLRVTSLKLYTGSPPRMRGKVSQRKRGHYEKGITPAYAGKRAKRWRPKKYVQDHPRVCGEKTKKIPSHRPFQLHPVPVSFSFA